MLSGPGALPRVSLLTQLSYIARVNWLLMDDAWWPLFSNIIPLCVCQGYLRIAHWHVLGWSIRSLHSGACRWKDVCCVKYISLAMSWGLVRMSPWAFCMQSRELSIVGWKIFLCIVLGLMPQHIHVILAVFEDYKHRRLTHLSWNSQIRPQNWVYLKSPNSENEKKLQHKIKIWGQRGTIDDKQAAKIGLRVSSHWEARESMVLFPFCSIEIGGYKVFSFMCPSSWSSSPCGGQVSLKGVYLRQYLMFEMILQMLYELLLSCKCWIVVFLNTLNFKVALYLHSPLQSCVGVSNFYYVFFLSYHNNAIPFLKNQFTMHPRTQLKLKGIKNL